MCQTCGLAYPVRDDIPVLLVDEARSRPDAVELTHGDLVRRVPAGRRGGLATADVRLRELAESGARVRREAGDAAAAPRRGGRRRGRASVRARSSRPDPTRGCCVPCSSRVPGAVRRLARPGPARLGRWRSTWSSCWRPTARTPRHRVRGRRGRTPRLPGRRRLPAGSLVAEHAAGRWHVDRCRR